MKTNYSSVEKPHGVVVGDIFSMSWGYDQTNVNYFQVTRASAKGVWVREIGAVSVPGTQGFMCENVKPNKGAFLDRSQWCSPRGQSFGGNVETFRRVQISNWNKSEEPYFNFRGRYFAYKVKGDGETYNSWYA